MTIQDKLRDSGLTEEADTLASILGASADEDKIFDFTVSKLKTMYRKYNKKYFDNELPIITIKKIANKRLSGVVKFVRTGSGDDMTAKITYLGISDVFQYTEKTVTETLLHEMIHVYYINKGGRFVLEDHGSYFQTKAKELNRISGYNISLTNSDAPKGVRENRRLKVGAVIYRAGGMSYYTMISLPVFKREIDKIASILSRSNDELATFTFYITESAFSRTKKVHKTLKKISWYDNPRVISDIIKEGKKVLEMKPSDNTTNIKLPSWV